MKQALIDWYNAHIVAGWYRSYALWVGMLAAVAPYAIDWLQGALDNWAAVSGFVQMSTESKEAVRLFLLIVVLPLARAWQQKTMQDAATKQQAEKQK